MTENKLIEISCPTPLNKKEVIRLGHGSGGRMTQQLLEEFFLPAFENDIISQCQDAAIAPFDSKNVVVTTDSYVVSPIFFPGGNIGSLCVHGTVNDLCMRGAKPLYMTISFILEEGLHLSILKEIINSISIAAKQCKIKIIAGDTKVVNKGACDQIFINTTGIGSLRTSQAPGLERVQSRDIVIVSGDLGRHGTTIMCARNNFELESELKSDTASLNEVVKKLFEEQLDISCLRDITRGGLATCLNEISIASKLSIEVEENLIPVGKEVQGACEILGLDPLLVACEGRFLCIAPQANVERILQIMRSCEVSKEACIIGQVLEETPGRVIMKTSIGGKRYLEMLTGEQLPRIC